MENTLCSYDGCGNKRASNPSGLCRPHRRLELGEGLRPLRRRSRLQSVVCTGPECTRPSEAHDLCKMHGEQLRKAGELHVIGDPAHRSMKSRQAWERRSPEEKVAHIAKMQSAQPRVRPEEHIRKIAEANKAAWAAKNIEPGDRPCLTCGTVFQKSGLDKRQFYCSAECRRLYARLRRHGISFQQYQDFLTAQDNRCAICRGAWKGWSASLDQPHIDHCHKTGRVRGLLCGDCNTALGRFGDDAALLRRAADYLEG